MDQKKKKDLPWSPTKWYGLSSYSWSTSNSNIWVFESSAGFTFKSIKIVLYKYDIILAGTGSPITIFVSSVAWTGSPSSLKSPIWESWSSLFAGMVFKSNECF